MLILFIVALMLSICVFMLKRSFWLSTKKAYEINLRQSFFCWFTFQDISQSENPAIRWIFVINNISNVIIAICFLMMLVCITLLGLSIVS